jgi:hypothetical protein
MRLLLLLGTHLYVRGNFDGALRTESATAYGQSSWMKAHCPMNND